MAKRQPAAAPPEQPRSKRPPPEMKFSVGGIGVAVWLNTVDTDQGERSFRSVVTIAPKRYIDKQTGEWKNGMTAADLARTVHLDGLSHSWNSRSDDSAVLLAESRREQPNQEGF